MNNKLILEYLDHKAKIAGQRVKLNNLEKELASMELTIVRDSQNAENSLDPLEVNVVFDDRHNHTSMYTVVIDEENDSLIIKELFGQLVSIAD